jgi:hypothetical protein
MELIQNENARKAQQLLRFYFRRLFDASKAVWDADAAGDIESIVPALLDALDERVALAIAKAVLTGQAGEKPERMKVGTTNLRLASIERMSREKDGFRITYTSGGFQHLIQSEGEPLWDLLNAQSIDLEKQERKAP